MRWSLSRPIKDSRCQDFEMTLNHSCFKLSVEWLDHEETMYEVYLDRKLISTQPSLWEAKYICEEIMSTVTSDKGAASIAIYTTPELGYKLCRKVYFAVKSYKLECPMAYNSIFSGADADKAAAVDALTNKLFELWKTTKRSVDLFEQEPKLNSIREAICKGVDRHNEIISRNFFL